MEQPYPTYLWQVIPWNSVSDHPRTERLVVDQCMLGQTDGRLPVKKPTELAASSQLLLKPFLGYRCDGKHQHASKWGISYKPYQVWTWPFARCVVEGIKNLKPRSYFQLHNQRSMDDTVSSRGRLPEIPLHMPGASGDLQLPLQLLPLNSQQRLSLPH